MFELQPLFLQRNFFEILINGHELFLFKTSEARLQETSLRLRHKRGMSDASEAKHPLIALHLLAGAERFLKVVGKFHGRPAIGIIELAHQTDRIEVTSALRIAVAKIIGKQGAPSRAEADAAFGNPLSSIEKIARLPKIRGRSAIANRAGEVGMQTQNRVHIQGVRSNEKLLPRIAPSLFEPHKIFVACKERIFAVRALPRPVRHPIRSVAEKLRRAKGIWKQNAQLAVIGLLPELQQAVLRGLQFFVIPG